MRVTYLHLAALAVALSLPDTALPEDKATPPTVEQSLPNLLSHCKSGDGNSCWTLGTVYLNGHGVDKDPWQAAAFFKQSCEAGDPKGCSGIGIVSLEDPQYGEGQSAVYWLDRGCELGDTGACYMLADMYRQGVKVKTAEDKARDYTQKTIRSARRQCTLGEGHACELLGDLYTKSPYLRRDENKARGFYNQACLNLNSRGCAVLATQYDPEYDDIKDETSLNKAITYYSERCKLGFPHACISLSLVYSDPALNRVEPDHIRALQSMTMACDLGEAMGCLALGTMYSQGYETTKDARKALENYLRSCELGEGLACGRVGFYYLNGIGVDQDEILGLDFMQTGCNLDDSYACLVLGNHLLKRRGESALPEVISFFERGCLNDDGQSCTALGDLYAQNGGTRQLREAERLYESACDLEDGYGCLKLLRLRQAHSLRHINQNETIEFYQRACDFGNAEGCELLRAQ
ncbi:MAG: sel1 repeat family protein [Succinivibrio sp.]|nr:sel1 repeat family protein [Succinivibrio sp.]